MWIFINGNKNNITAIMSLSLFVSWNKQNKKQAFTFKPWILNSKAKQIFHFQSYANKSILHKRVNNKDNRDKKQLWLWRNIGQCAEVTQRMQLFLEACKVNNNNYSILNLNRSNNSIWRKHFFFYVRIIHTHSILY